MLELQLRRQRESGGLSNDKKNFVKCAAKVSGAVGDELEDYPSDVREAHDLWAEAQTEENGKKIIEILDKYLQANFVTFDFEDADEFIAEPECEAIFAGLTRFDYDGASILPAVNATAIFNIQFVNSVTGKDIDTWQLENEDLALGINFYFDFGEQEVYLDTHSGIEFWVAGT